MIDFCQDSALRGSMSTTECAPDRVLCTYHYDPLDRLSRVGPDEGCQRFYQKNRLASEIKAASTHTVFQHDDTVLAESVQHNNQHHSLLLVTDRQGSVMWALSVESAEPLRYMPYGYHLSSSGLAGLLRFNGERADDVTGHYLLGNGYRAFNPVLMRFNSPDRLSPFGDGGLNAYGYCAGDPVNRLDPEGSVYSSVVHKAAGKFLNLIGRQPRSAVYAPRLTRMPAGRIKDMRVPQRLIAHVDESSSLKALPEERMAPTPKEWYRLESSEHELLMHHRRYVKSPRQMLSEKRQSIRRLANERMPAQSTVQKNMDVGHSGFSTRLEVLQHRIKEQRKQAGRFGDESPLGFAFGIRSNSNS